MYHLPPTNITVALPQGAGRLLLPTNYVIRNGPVGANGLAAGGNIPRTWHLLARANEQDEWVVLKMHKKDSRLGVVPLRACSFNIRQVGDQALIYTHLTLLGVVPLRACSFNIRQVCDPPPSHQTRPPIVVLRIFFF